MRDTSKRGWQSWRVKLAETPAEASPLRPFARTRIAGPADPSSREVPGADGIRHGLVARIRAEIEAGTYDTEERWRLAQERLEAAL